MLVLGRISNLPTVWSNCLAAWLLGGGGRWETLIQVCLGSTLLYMGGMFLNDAFDVSFDIQHRPERPIPSGRISRRLVWILASLFLGLGWLVLMFAGRPTALLASLLLGNIILYNAVHKHTQTAPWLMAGCRFFLYLVAASAATQGVNWASGMGALVLAAYILGLSALARGEYARSSQVLWATGALFAPLVLALAKSWANGPSFWMPATGLVFWIIWCISNKEVWPNWLFGRGVAGLLAGIALVDWLAVAPQEPALGGWFLGLFFLALLLQRVAPAT